MVDIDFGWQATYWYVSAQLICSALFNNEQFFII